MPGFATNRSNRFTARILKAQAAQTLAHQELDRISVLAARSDASQQQRDNARAEAARADADVAVAEARYAEAQLGPTAEERALADAHCTQPRPRATLSRPAPPRCCSVRLPLARSPWSPGTWRGRHPRRDVADAGARRAVWLGFNLREDALGDYAIGATVPLSTTDGDFSGRLTELRTG